MRVPPSPTLPLKGGGGVLCWWKRCHSLDLTPSPLEGQGRGGG
jgi:hypothetical protein